jgi:hypothetical protein
VNAPTRTLSRALALALPLLAACSEAPVSPTPVVDHATRTSVPFKGAPDHSAAIAGTTGEIQFLGPTVTAGSTITLPIRGPAPDIDGIVAAARSQLATMPRPTDPRLAARRDAATALLEARDIADVRRILASDARSLARTQAAQPTALGGSRVTTAFQRGGADLLRVRIENAPARRRDPHPLAQGPNLGYVTPIGADDPCMGLTGDPAYWPAACVPGYDPSYDPTQVANDVASMYASLSSMNAAVAAAESDPRGTPRCDAVKAAYYASVGAFVFSAAESVFWAFEKNPPRAWSAMQRTWKSLVAVNVANISLRECLSRQF